MGLLSSRNALIGMVLMVVGTLALVPGLFPGTAQLTSVALVVGSAALVVGTWLVGTSESDRPV